LRIRRIQSADPILQSNNAQSNYQITRLLDYPIHMRLYVEPMDAVVVEVTDDGRVRLDDGDLAIPTLQERRAILYSAKNEMAALAELIEILDTTDKR
jgi:hypothetical protein